MTAYVARHRVGRSIEAVFDVIGTRSYENHARWEREVEAIRPLAAGPIGVGSRAIMVRKEFGRRQEITYEVTDFTPPRLIAFRHLGGQMLFEIAFRLEEAGPSATDLAVHVRMNRAAPSGSWHR